MTDTCRSRPQFSDLRESTANDWHSLMQGMRPLAEELPDRVLAHLKLLKDGCGIWPVDRLEHSLQCATRAYRDGRDEEYVVVALLHDIGDTLGIYNHADIGAAMLKPFVSEENHWILQPQHAKIWYGVVEHFLARNVLGKDIPLPADLGL